jgi:hypothetical protein
VAGGEGVSGSVDSGFREVVGSGESRGAEDGGHRERRRSGRMTAAAEEQDTTTMATDRGRKGGQVLEGEGHNFLYIDTPLVPARVANRDKRGAFCHGW